MELQSLSADYLSLMSGAGGAELGALFSDVTFSVEGRQLPAHRCILAARSPFFRLMFSHHSHLPSTSTSPYSPSPTLLPRPPSLFVPLDVVGFDAFLALLRFLYSGQLILSPPSLSSPCPVPSCPHSSCSYVVDLLLQLIPTAHFFGVHQLADLVQAKLGNVLEEGVSLESLMRVLVVAKKHKMQRVWHVCADLVINTGLDCDILHRFLPRDVIEELSEMRLQRSGCMQNNMQFHDHVHPPQNLIKSPSCCSMMCNINAGAACCGEEQKILRLQQALDCMDVELVRLMVMGEGLNLDKALALHYSVANCNREVVKALLELGVVNVNYSDSLGRTALHLAADMGNAEMIAVLLDHHADPNVLTHDGFAAVDILRGLIKAGSQDPFHHDQHPPVMLPLCKADQKRIHLCIELLQSAAAVAGREEAAESTSCVTQAAAQIFNKNINQDTPAFMSRAPAAALIAISCGLGLMDGGVEAAVSIRDDQVRTTRKATRSSQFDSISGALQHDRSMQKIIVPQLNQELASGSSPLPSPLSSISPHRTVIDKDKHSGSISSNDLNHFTPQINRISVMNGESSSLISPRAVNHNVNHGLYLVNASYSTGAYQDLQSCNDAAAQGGKSMNAGTGSSSEE